MLQEDRLMTPAEKLAKRKAAMPSKPNAVRRVWDCRLRELRTALNLTQRDVAEAVGLSAAGYHQIETCGNDVCLSTCVKLSAFFGKPITEIWIAPKEPP
jgi:DNA-binding XRE family transcriptional regulator